MHSVGFGSSIPHARTRFAISKLHDVSELGKLKQRDEVIQRWIPGIIMPLTFAAWDGGGVGRIGT